MRIQLGGFFLTFVLAFSSALAAPHEYTSPPEDTAPSEPANYRGIEENNLSLTEPKPLSKSMDPTQYYYPFRQAISPRLGVLHDQRDIDDNDGELRYILGFNYLVPRYRMPQWEIGADATSHSLGYLNIMLRWIHQPRSSFRPYTKVGLTHVIEPEERFATLVNIDNYLAKGAVGLEHLVKMPLSFRAEVEVALGIRDVLVVGSVGYSWGW